MAKDKNNAPTNSEFINGIKLLLEAVTTPVPKDASPFEIAQHAAASVRLSSTPNASTAREIVTKAADELIVRYRTETATLS